MNFELFGIIALCLVVVVMFILAKVNPSFEKYWKFTIILAPVIFVLLIKLLSNKKVDENGTTEFAKKIDDVKDDMKEAQTIADIKTNISIEKKKEKLEQLKEVTKIADKSERRKKLAEMLG